MTSQGASRYEYDAALSFAGADRKAAEQLARNLKSRGFKVFYDRDHLASLWGKRQSDFENIYGPKSRFVIPFVSKHYVGKDWTRLEFDSAKREARRRSGEFILPIRVDDNPATISRYYAKWTPEFQSGQDDLIRKIHVTDLAQAQEQAVKC
jgi:hypothetical protein